MTDDDEQRPGPLDPDDDAPTPASDPGPLMIGPILGVIIGYITFQLLPEDTPMLLGLVIAVFVIALVIYITIEVGRRRTRRR
jgi:hypothetical protein